MATSLPLGRSHNSTRVSASSALHVVTTAWRHASTFVSCATDDDGDVCRDIARFGKPVGELLTVVKGVPVAFEVGIDVGRGTDTVTESDTPFGFPMPEITD